MQTVIVVVDSDKAHTEKRENLFNVFARLQMISSETGKILDHDAVDLACLYVRHHFLKGRALKIRARKPVVHFNAALPQLRMAT